MPPDSLQSVLIYDRIDSNRRRTMLSILLFTVELLPPLVYVSSYLAVWVLMLMVGRFPLSNTEAVTLHVYITIAISAVTIALTVVIHFFGAAGRLLKKAGAVQVGDGEEKEVGTILDNLCIGSGLPRPKLYIVPTSVPNAFTVGLEPEDAALVVTRGLLQLLGRRELEGVLAHELSHIGNHDIRLNTTVAAFASLMQLPLDFCRFLFRINRMVAIAFLSWFSLSLTAVLFLSLGALFDPQLEEIFTPGLRLWTVFSSGMLVYLFFLAPLIGMLMTGMISRQREFLADADAALLTRNPQGLALALAGIDAAGQTGLKIQPAAAHLFIMDPRPHQVPWWQGWISSHPPVRERIAALAGMGEGIPPRLIEQAENRGLEFRSSHYLDLVPVAQEAGSNERQAEAIREAERPAPPLQESLVVKADADSIDKRVKCQLCGTEQNLDADFKCRGCGATISYYIRCGQ